MKFFEFNYEKKNGEKSERRVMSLHSTDKWVDCIDLNKLSDEKLEKLKTIQLQYEKDMQPFFKKAFRRFLKEGMTITHEEIIKE